MGTAPQFSGRLLCSSHLLIRPLSPERLKGRTRHKTVCYSTPPGWGMNHRPITCPHKNESAFPADGMGGMAKMGVTSDSQGRTQLSLRCQNYQSNSLWRPAFLFHISVFSFSLSQFYFLPIFRFFSPFCANFGLCWGNQLGKSDIAALANAVSFCGWCHIYNIVSVTTVEWFSSIYGTDRQAYWEMLQIANNKQKVCHS